jgi:carboxymethylenebutenolidase
MCHPEVPAGHVTPQVIRQEVSVPVEGGDQMPALLARPEGGDGPAILIISDAFGRSEFYEDLAARLAAAGFNALLPDLFFRLGPLPDRTIESVLARRKRMDQHQTLREMSLTVDWLKQQPGVRGDRVGTIGFCMGGTLVLDFTAQRDDLVTVCYYGLPGTSPLAGPMDAPSPNDILDQLRGPILAFWGDQDNNAGMQNVERLAAGLQERNVDFQHTIYPGLGHGFLATSRLDPNHEAYEKACDSWTRSLEYFRQRLGVRQPATA